MCKNCCFLPVPALILLSQLRQRGGLRDHTMTRLRQTNLPNVLLCPSEKIYWVNAWWNWNEVHSTGPWTCLPAHLREPVCHTLARNDRCSNIFRGYCCQTWKLAHNYSLSGIAFLYFLTNHSSFSRSPTQTVICLLFRSQISILWSLPLMLRSPLFSYLLCFILLLNFKWTFYMK